MKLSQYKYNLPKERLAQYPPENRDESRLMVIHKKTGKIEHKIFKDILQYFNAGDTLVLNNTKVFPARLYGSKEKTGALIEVFLLRELNREQRLWDVLVEPARKIRIGNKLYFEKAPDLVAEVVDNTTSRGRTIRFLYDGEHEEFKKALHDLGETPLPREVRKEVEPIDEERFQTVYAKHEGAVAAPFAGLHFSRELLKRFEIKGINIAEITLHLGLGGFRVIDIEDLRKLRIDAEPVVISEKTVETVNQTKDQLGRVCAVGITSMRALETSTTTHQRITPHDGWTNKFIFPPYKIEIADMLITNFHPPQSYLMMVASAFTGYELLMDYYQIAIREEYRFGVYGDAMLIINY